MRPLTNPLPIEGIVTEKKLCTDDMVDVIPDVPPAVVFMNAASAELRPADLRAASVARSVPAAAALPFAAASTPAGDSCVPLPAALPAATAAANILQVIGDIAQ